MHHPARSCRKFGYAVIACGLILFLKTALGQGLDTWTSRSSETIAGLNLNDVAYGAGVFVAVGASGTITRSFDGAEWRQAVSGTLYNLEGVAFGNGLFVAVGGRGSPDHQTVLTSIDGDSWIRTRSITGNACNGLLDVAFGKGIFVAVGNCGGIWTSTNAQSWTKRAEVTPFYLKKVSFGNDLFIATGWNSLLTSRDGVTWRRHLAGVETTFSGAAMGPSTFVVATTSEVTDNYAAIFSSSDGTNWVSRRQTASCCLGDVTYGAGVFVATGLDANGKYPNPIATSTNGINWIERSTDARGTLYGVAYGNGTFVAVGANGLILQADYLPELRIQWNAGSLVISWPSRFAGFVLESSPTLSSANWEAEPLPTIFGDEMAVTLDLSTNARFFRARQQ